MDKYFKKYQWSDLFDFLRNEKLNPAVCPEDFQSKLVVISGITSWIGLETAHLRSDNGSEFTAKRVRSWLSRLQIKPLFIEPGSPWDGGFIESFN